MISVVSMSLFMVNLAPVVGRVDNTTALIVSIRWMPQRVLAIYPLDRVIHPVNN